MNIQITPDERAKANELLHDIPERIDVLSGGGANFAVRVQPQDFFAILSATREAVTIGHCSHTNSL